LRRGLDKLVEEMERVFPGEVDFFQEDFIDDVVKGFVD
jgi:hypothetical protein